jgi:hypothetical protein
MHMSHLYSCPILFAAAAALLAGCGAPPENGGYKVVRESYDYGAADQHSQQWNSQSAALEKCHQSGFTNAEPAAAPSTQCLEGADGGCRRWRASIAYDCVGMGWQDN